MLIVSIASWAIWGSYFLLVGLGKSSDSAGSFAFFVICFLPLILLANFFIACMSVGRILNPRRSDDRLAGVFTVTHAAIVIWFFAGRNS
jgi:hypothetical protein